VYEIGNNITLPEGDDNELRGKKYRIRRENNVKLERYKKKTGNRLFGGKPQGAYSVFCDILQQESRP